ncbi:MAG: carotenoid biosynthesis protein [Pseudomonadota bacterium]
MDLPILLWKTVLLRPYVFLFLAAFLAIAIPSMGLRRTLTFFIGTWILAFLSEFSSTRNGFPYGFYHYTGSTRGEELFISNVPFMDSLSYSFLLFASFSMALLTVAPLYVKKWDAQLMDTFDVRQSWKVLFLTALYMMMIDVVIDPLALLGDRWFLGRIYFYDEPGYYFGIPLSNAFGWGLVGLVAAAIYQFLERKFMSAGFRDIGIRPLRFQAFLGAGLYYGVLLFNLAITAWIGERGLLIAGGFIFLLPTVFLVLKVLNPRARVTEEEWRTRSKMLR